MMSCLIAGRAGGLYSVGQRIPNMTLAGHRMRTLSASKMSFISMKRAENSKPVSFITFEAAIKSKNATEV